MFLDDVIFSFSLTFHNQLVVYNDKVGAKFNIAVHIL